MDASRRTAATSHARPGPHSPTHAGPCSSPPRLSLGTALAGSWPWLLTGLVLLGALLRCLAARGDFWLDEIWSLANVLGLDSYTAIVTQLRHDNNHILNSAWMRLLGDQPNWRLYRIPAVLTGTLSVLLMGLVERRTGRRESLLATLVLAVSYPFVLYGSEARGYAPATCLALAAWLCGQRVVTDAARHRPSWGLAYATTMILGPLAHLSFVYAFLALAVWTTWQLAKGEAGPRRGLLRAAALNVSPSLFLLWLWWVFVRHLDYGGGPARPLVDVIVEAMTMLLGAPGSWLLALAACLVGMALFIWGLTPQGRGSDEATLLVLAVVVAPLGILWVTKPTYLFPRYFLVSAPFVVAGMARALAWLSRRGHPGKLACGLLLALFLAGSGLRLAPLLEHGRGHYLDALRFMADHTPSEIVAVTGDHDFRNGLVLEYYARHLPPAKQLFYVARSTRPPVAVPWLLLHSMNPKLRPQPFLIMECAGNAHRRYALAAEFPFGGTSGWAWFVYRLMPREGS